MKQKQPLLMPADKNQTENQNWNHFFTYDQTQPVLPEAEKRKRLLLKFIWKWFFRWWVVPLTAALFASFIVKANANARKRKKYKKIIKEGILWDTTYWVEKD